MINITNWFHRLCQVEDNKYNLFIWDFLNYTLEWSTELTSLLNEILCFNDKTILNIYINSDWWDAHELLQFYSTFQSSWIMQANIVCNLIRWESCWAFFFFLFENKNVYKDSFLMIHFPRFNYNWTTKNVIDRVKFKDKLLEDFYLREIKWFLSWFEINQMWNWKELYFNALKIKRRISNINII